MTNFKNDKYYVTYIQQ